MSDAAAYRGLKLIVVQSRLRDVQVATVKRRSHEPAAAEPDGRFHQSVTPAFDGRLRHTDVSTLNRCCRSDAESVGRTAHDDNCRRVAIFVVRRKTSAVAVQLVVVAPGVEFPPSVYEADNGSVGQMGQQMCRVAWVTGQYRKTLDP